MSTPPANFSPDTYTDFATANAAEPIATPAAINPDDPPWGVGLAFLIWLSSIVLLFVVQLIAVVPYVIYRYRGSGVEEIQGAMTSDSNVIVISILSVLPAHILTLGIAWALVTRFGKRPFRETIGWSWSPRLGFWKCVVLAVILLVVAGTVAYLLGGQKTPFEEMLQSSAAALFATAFMATATAPLVEETIYRGILFPAMQRLTGTLWAVVLVGGLFTLVHVAQYYNNLGVIVAVGLLGFALTYVRARTGRLLPCVVIHLVFNGIQVVGLIYEYLRKDAATDGGETKTAFCVSLVEQIAAHAPSFLF